MERIIFPVGQGAFYVEKFLNNNSTKYIVYDCGSQNQNRLISSINKVFKKDEEIEAVFISHFDGDHVSGLYYLLTTRKVKRLFFPLITEEIIEEYQIRRRINLWSDDIVGNNENENQFIESFLANPRETCKILEDRTPELFQIRPIKITDDNQDYHVYHNIEIIDSAEDLKNLLKIDVFNSETLEESAWSYIPYNYSYKERFMDFKDKLLNKIKPIATVSTVADVMDILNKRVEKELNCDEKELINKTLKIVKDTYREVKGKINANSMVLLSFCQNNTISIRACIQFYSNLQFPCPYCRIFLPIPNGCLYMGDFEAQNDVIRSDLIKNIQKYLFFIGTVQVPHHGLQYNFSKSLFFANALFFSCR